MTRTDRTWWVLIAIFLLAVLAGCSANMTEKGVEGAATGAVSAALTGAISDLIWDGEIDTDRLARRAASGAVAGATAGAAAGHRQDQVEAQKEAASASAEDASDEELIERIGRKNYSALEDLLYFRYEDAYRTTLKTVKSKDEDHRDAGYVVQALIDRDRGNRRGAEEAIAALIDANQHLADADSVNRGLDELLAEFEDERRVRGISRP